MSVCVFLYVPICLSVCGQLVTETDSSCQVIGPATSAQTLNAGVVNSLYKFHQAVSKVSLLCRLVGWSLTSLFSTAQIRLYQRRQPLV